ncbi:hypothetical protein CU044_1423 [Streptomyces sp. L-9-10]|nr:hypothetical protein CU044_1423 [Streptomyces sp. L-9-10]
MARERLGARPAERFGAFLVQTPRPLSRTLNQLRTNMLTDRWAVRGRALSPPRPAPGGTGRRGTPEEQPGPAAPRSGHLR